MACPPGRGGREFGDSLKPPGFYFDHSVHLTEEEDSGRRQVWKAVGSVCLFVFEPDLLRNRLFHKIHRFKVHNSMSLAYSQSGVTDTAV